MSSGQYSDYVRLASHQWNKMAALGQCLIEWVSVVSRKNLMTKEPCVAYETKFVRDLEDLERNSYRIISTLDEAISAPGSFKYLILCGLDTVIEERK